MTKNFLDKHERIVLQAARAYVERQKLKADLRLSIAEVLREKLSDPKYRGVKSVRVTYKASHASVAQKTMARITQAFSRKVKRFPDLPNVKRERSSRPTMTTVAQATIEKAYSVLFGGKK